MIFVPKYNFYRLGAQYGFKMKWQGFFWGALPTACRSSRGQGLNLSHGSEPSHSSDNTESLITRPPGTSLVLSLLLHSVYYKSHQVQPTLKGRGISLCLLHGGVLKNLWVYFKATTLGVWMTLHLWEFHSCWLCVLFLVEFSFCFTVRAYV